MTSIRKSVLLAEPEMCLQAVIGTRLRENSYELHCLKDGSDALEQVQIQRPDILIAECQLPGCSGTELACRLRQIPSFSELPIVLLSNPGYTAALPMRLLSDNIQLLEKPFRLAELLAIVAEYTENPQLAAAN